VLEKVLEMRFSAKRKTVDIKLKSLFINGFSWSRREDCFLNAQTFSGSSPWQRKKEPQSALFPLVEATGLAVCCGCALHTNGSTTVASDSTRLTAPR